MNHHTFGTARARYTALSSPVFLNHNKEPYESKEIATNRIVRNDLRHWSYLWHLTGMVLRYLSNRFKCAKRGSIPHPKSRHDALLRTRLLLAVLCVFR